MAHFSNAVARGDTMCCPRAQWKAFHVRIYSYHCLQVTKEEYNRVGSKALGEILALELQKSGKNPYVIPVGGSSSVGTWGYIECVHELLAQIGDEGFTDIVVVRIQHGSCRLP